MTFQEAVEIGMKQTGNTGNRDFFEGQVRYLVALGILKLDDMKPADEYEQILKAREIMDRTDRL